MYRHKSLYYFMIGFLPVNIEGTPISLLTNYLTAKGRRVFSQSFAKL
jgi:hypothetical protein